MKVRLSSDVPTRDKHSRRRFGDCIRARRVRRARVAARLYVRRLGTAEHDHGASGNHPRAATTSAPNPVHDGLKVLEIAHSDMDERVRVACEREGREEFWEIGDGVVDLGHLGTGSEAQFDKRLDLLAEATRVQLDGVPADQATGFESVDPSLSSGRREPDETPDFARGTTSVTRKDIQNRMICRIELCIHHFQSIKP